MNNILFANFKICVLYSKLLVTLSNFIFKKKPEEQKKNGTAALVKTLSNKKLTFSPNIANGVKCMATTTMPSII